MSFTCMNFVDDEMADAHHARWGARYRYEATVNCLNEEADPKRVDVNALSGLHQMRSGVLIAPTAHISGCEINCR